MATARTSNTLLLEVAPPLQAGGRPLPVGQLHRLLSRGGKSRWPAEQGDALLLAAFKYQLALRLLEDLGLASHALTSKRWRWQLRPGAERIHSCKIGWLGVDSAIAKPLPGVRSFLADVPDEMVRLILAWAPPVVQPQSADGTSCVVANYLSALLARHRLPDQRVEVRRLRYATTLRRPLPEMCQGIVHVLEPVYAQHRQRIVELTAKVVQAKLLTGYSRAQSFRIKKRRND